MGRYITRFSGGNPEEDYDNTIYKYAFAEQESELGEIIERLRNGSEPFRNSSGEIVWLDKSLLPDLRALRNKLRKESSREAELRVALLDAVIRDVEQHGEGYFFSEYG